MWERSGWRKRGGETTSSNTLAGILSGALRKVESHSLMQLISSRVFCANCLMDVCAEGTSSLTLVSRGLPALLDLILAVMNLKKM